MKKLYSMKFLSSILLLILCCLFTGCGKEETAQYLEIQSESTPFFDVASSITDDPISHFLGSQFYQGESVQLWALRSPDSNDAYTYIDIYLYRMDGSRELVQKNMPVYFNQGLGYLGMDGEFYHWQANDSITKVGADGKQLYRRKLNEFDIRHIDSLCQLADGRIFLLYEPQGEVISATLGELDPETGTISSITTVNYSFKAYGCLGANGNNLLYLSEEGIRQINTENGNVENVWSIQGTYRLNLTPVQPVWDFRILESGEAELLWSDKKGNRAKFESLCKVDISEGRKPVVMRGISFTYNQTIKEQAALFNQTNEDYFVVLEECGFGIDPEDYARQTSIEIAAGKGPDILYGDVLGDYVYGVAQKGGLADLRPYLEEANISEEDFFPCAFDCWRYGDSLYSFAPLVSLRGVYMDAAVLGKPEEVNIEILVDALLSYTGNAVYQDGKDAGQVLRILLEGSENLWGMVDWENGGGDFDTELFAKILEAAKRYGDDGHNNYPGLVQNEWYSPYTYLDSTLLKEKGKVIVGELFDGGCRAKLSSSNVMAVNANSEQKDAAWAFISMFLNSLNYTELTSTYPTNKDVCRTIMAQALAKAQEPEQKKLWEQNGDFYNTNYGEYELTEARVKELTEAIESAKFLPSRTDPILKIILEEAAYYFDGSKSIEEVIAVINNRVKLYLKEIQ